MKVQIKCPPRIGFSGFYAVGQFFPEGVGEYDFSEKVVATIEGEIARKESILELTRIEAEPEADPESKPAKRKG
jgi:hypothetical protein